MELIDSILETWRAIRFSFTHGYYWSKKSPNIPTLVLVVGNVRTVLFHHCANLNTGTIITVLFVHYSQYCRYVYSRCKSANHLHELLSRLRGIIYSSSHSWQSDVYTSLLSLLQYHLFPPHIFAQKMFVSELICTTNSIIVKQICISMHSLVD